MQARHLAVGEEIARWEDNTILALERNGSLLAAFHSGGVAEERQITVDTAFGPHVRLRDQAGDGKPVETDGAGRVTLTLEPHSYVYYAPAVGKRARPKPKPLPTRQTWEFADDLDTGRLTGKEQRIKVMLDKGQRLKATLALDGEETSKMALDLRGQTLRRGGRSLRVAAAPEAGIYTLRVWTTSDAPRAGTLTVER